MSIESCATDVFLNHISKLVMCVSLTTLPEKLKNNKKKATGMVLCFQTKCTQRRV